MCIPTHPLWSAGRHSRTCVVLGWVGWDACAMWVLLLPCWWRLPPDWRSGAWWVTEGSVCGLVPAADCAPPVLSPVLQATPGKRWLTFLMPTLPMSLYLRRVRWQPALPPMRPLLTFAADGHSHDEPRCPGRGLHDGPLHLAPLARGRSCVGGACLTRLPAALVACLPACCTPAPHACRAAR